MVRFIMHGCNGKMGQTISRIVKEDQSAQIVAGVDKYLGIANDYPVFDSIEKCDVDADVIIDFSTKEMAMEVVKLAIAHKKALVCGTTGFTAEEFAEFEKAAEFIPMLYAANTSKLVNVMNKLLELVAKTVGNELDIEILEMHDQWKKDAPSGTSKEMGEVMAHALGKELSEIKVHGREGDSPRVPGTIGYHSLRAGNISSSHTVFFGGMGERLEITHHSYNWECFARGACDCAAFLKDKAAGFYTIKDVLNL